MKKPAKSRQVARNSGGTKKRPPRADAEVRRAAIIPDLLSGEYTHHEIALRHGVGDRFVDDVSSELREDITRTKEQAKEDALKRLRRSAKRAAEVLAAGLGDRDPKVRHAAALAVLDRVGAIRSEGREIEAGEGAVELSRLVTRSLEITAATRRGEPRPAELGTGTNDHAGDEPGKEASAGAEEDGDVE